MIAFLIQKFFDISDFLDLFGRSFDNPNRAIDRQGNSLSWQMSHHTGQSFHSAIITHRDISVMGNLSESVRCWKSRRGHGWDYSINFLCKHKTVATLEPIRGVRQTYFLSYTN